MYFIKRRIYRWIFRLLKLKPTDMDMVQYWKTKESVQAKVTRSNDGALIMKMEGEKYHFPGFPRGHLLFGSLSKLKHEIKNQLFNESWRSLEDGIPKEKIIVEFKRKLRELIPLIDAARFDVVPPEKMVASVREIWRAWTVIEEKFTGEKKKFLNAIKRALTFILLEDDGYRFRLQWIIQIFNPSSLWFKIFFRNPIKDFEIALVELENGEMIGDMKERIRLLRRILLLILEDKNINKLFRDFCKEMDWNKLKLSAEDKYHFRGKWFKVDFMCFEY